MMEEKYGLIFDMDGTLWDSSLQVAKSWTEAVKNKGLDREITREDVQGVMGKTMDVIAEILFGDFDKEGQKTLLEECCRVENDYLRESGGELYPELVETLVALKKDFHLYIVSNCQAGYIEAFLDHYKMWDLFEDIECFGNNGKQKGENIRLLFDRNELTKAAYVGDIQGDYDATMQAGLPFIHASYGFGKIKEPVAKISTFSDLLTVAKDLLF